MAAALSAQLHLVSGYIYDNVLLHVDILNVSLILPSFWKPFTRLNRQFKY